MATPPLLLTWVGMIAINWLTQVGSPPHLLTTQSKPWFSKITAPSATHIPIGSTFSLDRTDWKVWSDLRDPTSFKITQARASLDRGELLILEVASRGKVFWRVNLQKGTVYSQEFGTETLAGFIKRVRSYSSEAAAERQRPRGV